MVQRGNCRLTCEVVAARALVTPAYCGAIAIEKLVYWCRHNCIWWCDHDRKVAFWWCSPVAVATEKLALWWGGCYGLSLVATEKFATCIWRCSLVVVTSTGAVEGFWHQLMTAKLTGPSGRQ